MQKKEGISSELIIIAGIVSIIVAFIIYSILLNKEKKHFIKKVFSQYQTDNKALNGEHSQYFYNGKISAKTLRQADSKRYWMLVLLPSILVIFVYPFVGRFFAEIASGIWDEVGKVTNSRGEVGNWTKEGKFRAAIALPFLPLVIFVGLIAWLFVSLFKFIWDN